MLDPSPSQRQFDHRVILVAFNSIALHRSQCGLLCRGAQRKLISCTTPVEFDRWNAYSNLAAELQATILVHYLPREVTRNRRAFFVLKVHTLYCLSNCYRTTNTTNFLSLVTWCDAKRLELIKANTGKLLAYLLRRAHCAT